MCLEHIGTQHTRAEDLTVECCTGYEREIASDCKRALFLRLHPESLSDRRRSLSPWRISAFTMVTSSISSTQGPRSQVMYVSLIFLLFFLLFPLRPIRTLLSFSLIPRALVTVREFDLWRC